MNQLTPMMQQFMTIKKKHPDSILFFRLGDFYEMFFEDALVASKILEITLTARECGLDEKAPMCGVPFHSADGYISKLIENGKKVAICEQVEEPSNKKLVKREVVRIITPGTVIDEKVLDEKKNNYLCSLYLTKNECGIAYADVSTGSIFCVLLEDMASDRLLVSVYHELQKISPTETITNKSLVKLFSQLHLNTEEPFIDSMSLLDSPSDWSHYVNIIKTHFEVISIEALGITPTDKAVVLAVGMLIDYLQNTQRIALSHLNHLVTYYPYDYMAIDSSTRKNLELVEPIRGTNKKNTLFYVIDHTKTAMGARKLKKWLLEPLQNISGIEDRQDAVECLYHDTLAANNITQHLKQVYDIERLLSRIVYGNCNARDMNALKQSIEVLPDLVSDISSLNCDLFKDISTKLDTLKDVYDLIGTSIVENPPVSIKEGGLIKDGYHTELDELREITTHGKDWINQLVAKERESTGIKNLKIGFNRIFGYYIEVTKSYIKLVPDHYIRKQTLANAERYVTPDLKEMESKILNASAKLEKLEYELFQEIRTFVNNQLIRIQTSADYVAVLDALNSLCTVAIKNSYKRPKINHEGYINIVNGRHPVVEKVLLDNLFIPNNTYINTSDQRFSIVTGPNMAGKSTYMRQVALITILAHIGSFVPAEEADICLVDKVFSRVGASDDLSSGQSTFMVEMSEVSNIIKNATPDSLVILDEIARGTSTYDGLSIAWAVTEYMVEKIRSKTLFATHYHELSALEDKIEGIRNYKILIKESGDDIIFLRKIAKGSVDKSYGIHVARLAGIPNDLIKRAFDILHKLELSDFSSSKPTSTDLMRTEKSVADQMAFWDLNNEYKAFINESLMPININHLTPIQAMNLLSDLIEKAKELNQ